MAKPGKHTVGGGRVVHPKGLGPWLLPPHPLAAPRTPAPSLPDVLETFPS